MSKFQVNVKKPEPNTADIDRFAEAADAPGLSSSRVARQTATGKGAVEKLTINFTVRLSETDNALLTNVFENSKEKSKQKLVRKIVLDGLESMRRELK